MFQFFGSELDYCSRIFCVFKCSSSDLKRSIWPAGWRQLVLCVNTLLMFNMSEWWFRCESTRQMGARLDCFRARCTRRVQAERAPGGWGREERLGGGSSPWGAEPEVQIITAATSVKVFFGLIGCCRIATRPQVCFVFLHLSLWVKSPSNLEMFISINMHFQQ